MNKYDLPDFPLWGWIIAMTALAAAIAIPFWMLMRIKGIRYLRERAKARSKGTYIAFWILFVPVGFLNNKFFIFSAYIRNKYFTF